MRFWRLFVFLILALPAMRLHAQEPLQIYASHSILADVVAQVAGDNADVYPLIPVGADAHAFQPTPQDLVRLSEADLVLLNGAGFEGALLEAIESAAETVPVVTVSACVPILPFAAAHEDGDDHDDDHDHSDEGQHHAFGEEVEAQCDDHQQVLSALMGAETLAAHGEIEPLGILYSIECGEELPCDPHVWHDPRNVMYWTLSIRDALSELDPSNAATYAANAASYLESLQTLYTELSGRFAAIPAEQRVMITNHDSFGYLANTFGLRVVGTVIPGGGTLAEPSAREIAALLDTINEAGVAAVFAENTTNAAFAEQLAADSGVQFYTLYSDSLSDSEGDAPTYVIYMRYNAATIAEALTQ